MKKSILLFFVFISFSVFAQIEDAWVYLTDKQNVTASINNPISILTQKAIDRKNKHGVTIDARDVPVNEIYITQLKNATGITVLAKSKWFNAVHVRGIETDIQALTDLSFVDTIDFADKSLNSKSVVKKGKKKNHSKLENTFTIFNYGDASNQIEMFKGDELHLAGFTGTGMTVAIMDSGFTNVNTMASFQRLRDAGNLLGSYDFVNREVNVYTGTNSDHGTFVLSNMAGYIENEFVGTAPDASYYLFITEDAPNENPVEESYWVEATERADSLGVDVINTSLGYTTYDNPNYSYTQADMDGNSAFITKGANIAFEKGLLLITSAGNSGNDSWGIVGAPADAPGVFTVGAVKANGDYANFSSKGNVTQPNNKPDVVAQGQASYVIGPDDVIRTLNGTSFSSPILAGGIVCLWQARPLDTNTEIMDLVRQFSSQSSNPDYSIGYGIPDLEMALSFLSLNSDINENIKIYPNPVKDKLYLELPSEENIISLRVFDILGKEVEANSFSKTNKEINLKQLSKGLYIFKLTSNTISKTFKIVKQ
ncbi:S8 family serine peptidase [uncultured Algibacter sp.]|uniref:S8 family serine peptidase n=1 Tax=uncultured Algibacter sp. TaxID=298659 RepID=UPI002603F2E4|nr:S8 family serine peptidase [uncultured Algibacter sp.]